MKENPNQNIQQRLQQHALDSPTLLFFNEGDIVYCHFPWKTIISDLKLLSQKLQMTFVAPLYIFSKHDKFMYILSNIDVEVIEQMFHVSRLRLLNSKYVRNINDYKVEMIQLQNKYVL